MAQQRIRIVDPLRDPSWDARLSDNPRATCFHATAWCRVLAETYAYAPRYCVTDADEPVLPLMEVDSWLTGRRGVSLPFTDTCDPLSADPALLAETHAALSAEGKSRGWKYVEYRSSQLTSATPQPPSTSFHGHVLDLVADSAAQFSRCDSATRRAVRKAEQSQLTIDFAQSPAAMHDFIALLTHTRRRHGAPVQPKPFFDAIQRHVLSAQHGWVVLARKDGRAVAGAVFLHQNRHAIFKFGASDQRFQHTRANNLVMWTAIQRYAQEGFATLDFGRTSIDNDGLRHFKLGWGAKEVPIAYFRLDLASGKAIPAPDRASSWHAPVFRRIPVFLSRMIGALIYRHIA